MKSEEEKSTNWKDYEEEEEVNHEHICYFVTKVEAKESLTLPKEIEGKLLDVSFINNEKKDSRKGILSDILWNSMVEKHLEEPKKQEVSSYGHGKFVKEEFKVISKESHSIWIFTHELSVCIVSFVIQKVSQSIESLSERSAELWITIFNELLRKRTPLECHLVCIWEQDVRVESQVMPVVKIEL